MTLQDQLAQVALVLVDLEYGGFFRLQVDDRGIAHYYDVNGREIHEGEEFTTPSGKFAYVSYEQPGKLPTMWIYTVLATPWDLEPEDPFVAGELGAILQTLTADTTQTVEEEADTPVELETEATE